MHKNSMNTVTYSHLQDLIPKIPIHKLSLAYTLLLELIEKESSALPNDDFFCLPLSERRQIMAQQAEKMALYYEETQQERQEWQAGDFIGEN